MPTFVSPFTGDDGSMPTPSLATLRTLVRERADMQNSAFVADSATGLDQWINEGIATVHGKLVEAYGEEYVRNEVTINVVNGTENYELPTDFFKLYEVDMLLAGKTRSLRPFNKNTRNVLRNSAQLNTYYVPRYRLLGRSSDQSVTGYIQILPAQFNAPVTLAYAPDYTPLVDPSDTWPIFNGWEKYVVAYAARKALLKEESDVRELDADLSRWDREFESLKENRDLNLPHSVGDVDELEEWDLSVWR
jgi:hypothetical protein